MRILLWHGYLLSGSGSNIYTRNIASEWRRGGHDVLCLCQERAAATFATVDAHGDLAPDDQTLSFEATDAPAAKGRCRVLRPFIGDVLPVYVYDEYEGFTVKRFVDLSDAELQAYNDRNIRAMRTVIDVFDPEAIVTGHEVMGPFIARRACEPTASRYIAKLHGSALEYAVKEQPQRFVPYAVDGLGGAAAVTGGSRYMIEEASALIPGWRERAAVVHPGADVDLFRPLDSKPAGKPIVGFVGKLIRNKGVHNLLAAFGLLHHDVSGVIVGFGDFESELRDLWEALHEGDGHGLERVLRSESDGATFDQLRAFLADAGPEFFARTARTEVRFPGRLDHGPLSGVLPTFDILVAPSIMAEAFGIVAAEAAASGVLPVVPRHSGIGEIGAALEDALGIPGLLTFDPDEAVEGIARRVNALLDLPVEERLELSLRASVVAHETWTWTRTASELLRHAAR